MKFRLSNEAFKRGTPQFIRQLRVLWISYGAGVAIYLTGPDASPLTLFGVTFNVDEQFLAHVVLNISINFLFSFFYEDSDNRASGDDAHVSGMQSEDRDDREPGQDQDNHSKS